MMPSSALQNYHCHYYFFFFTSKLVFFLPGAAAGPGAGAVPGPPGGMLWRSLPARPQLRHRGSASVPGRSRSSQGTRLRPTDPDPPPLWGLAAEQVTRRWPTVTPALGRSPSRAGPPRPTACPSAAVPAGGGEENSRGCLSVSEVPRGRSALLPR